MSEYRTAISGTVALLVATTAAPGFARNAATLSHPGMYAAPPMRRSFEPSLIYVASAATNAVTAYEANATGNATPVLTLAGPRTGLDGPVGLTFDATGELYVVNHGATSSVTVYAPSARGNAAPLRTLTGPQTHLRDTMQPPDYPTGAIAVDLTHDRMFVARVSPEQTPPFGDTVLVFRATASGDEAPLGSIGRTNDVNASGSIFETAPGIAVDGDQEILVGTRYNNCCNAGDGWLYYAATNLGPRTSFAYWENDGLEGFAVSPSTDTIVALRDDVLVRNSSLVASLDVWPPNVAGYGDCGACQFFQPPMRTLFDPLNVGFTAAAIAPNDTIWALSGNTALETFVPGSSTPRITGGLVGASAIAVAPLASDVSPCAGSVGCLRFLMRH